MLYILNTRFLFTLGLVGLSSLLFAQEDTHVYVEGDKDFTKDDHATEIHTETNSEVEHAEIHKEEEHHHKYELEISYNNSGHYEFTGSIYFAHLTKFQGTVEFTGKHFASVIVREIPIGHSRWGTFVGVGGTFGFHDHEVPTDEYFDFEPEEAPHPDDYSTSDMDQSHREWGGSVIVQTGIAYSLNSHWSTGFTLSPGIDVQSGEPTFGATVDVVFGF
ncbi:hypothetical protein [Flammeovirga kamogawensis]|uniref:Porin family protein n=1 Tax=Flammeovirga kamogawensis TaxID=373891 RepID=A0ABX8GYT1_9BACT|nr:hypothetical protein [Flammeovirga kamogawensis]MBB6459211.1 hypothetical protein [Flammeovirga kamogawensis]QWG08776.1 hypothetical protein KM029_07495 [Flammeovirga kamogawensis]TRX67066.1 hypothetical protein EO216_02540 [Flammeovirga kamogawensis]